MALDERVVDSLQRAIRKNKQPEAVGKRLIAWLNALALDPSALERPDEVKKHIENVLEAVVIDKDNDDDEESA